MNNASHDFVTVEMRGLKAALVERAQAQRVSVSALVRGAVARELGVSTERGAPELGSTATVKATAMVKVSIRMNAYEATKLAAGARAAMLSRGAYLAGLVAGVPTLTSGGRVEHVAVLRRSSAELATLSRNISRLTTLLRQADSESARPYRNMLSTLQGDVRRHLELAAGVLAGLQPQRRSNGEGERHVSSAQRRRRPDHLG